MSAAAVERPFLAAVSLARRELVTFFRMRSRVIGALATPLVFWLLLGAGMGRSFRSQGATGGEDFLEYFFPGIVLLAVVFAGIYSTISTIQDRQRGFLQAVLVAPVPRSSIVLGKILGGAAISLVQGVVLLLLAPLGILDLSLVGFVAGTAVLLLIAVSMTALGFLFAWRIDSVQGFHSIMNLILMPMWMLSGAFFPVGGAAGWIQAIMYANPLTYGLVCLRRALYLGKPEVVSDLPPLWPSLLVLVVCGVLAVIAASRAVARRGD